jgi:hypothetical protein
MAFLAEKYCELVFIDSLIPQTHAKLMFQKGSHFVEMFNQAITANEVHIQRIKRKYLVYKPPSLCSMKARGPQALSEFNDWF